MFSSNTRPKWWQLYLTFPLLIGLFMVDFRLKLSARGHQAVQIGILLLVYGLVHLWLKANATALSKMDQGHFQGTVIVTRVPQDYLTEPKSEKQSILQFNHSEVNGTLSDTFEMDYIDAQYISVDEVPQELNKE